MMVLVCAPQSRNMFVIMPMRFPSSLCVCFGMSECLFLISLFLLPEGMLGEQDESKRISPLSPC